MRLNCLATGNTMTHTLTLTLQPYVQLMRLDRPVGTLLLLWPTLAALWLAADGLPPWHLVLIFALGTFLMRSAGCVINDFADRDWDRHVERTAARPLTSGRLSERQAMLLFAGLSLAAALLLLFLNPLARWLALGGFAIAVLYPFLKRWTYLPQVGLGAAFSWGLIMAYASVQGRVPSEAWLLFLASLLWIVAYDTLYAMVDREDDLQVGIKSTAILFGSADRLIVGVLQLSATITLLLLGQRLGLGGFYYLGILSCLVLFAYQQYLIRQRKPDACFKAFLNNVWVGFSLFAGVVLDTMLQFQLQP
jgi:4-hydroxybenzoate polyprenyltransferase